MVGLGNAMYFIHSKGIVHNAILADNVCLRAGCHQYESVLVGFSNSCRSDSAKKLTITQQELFKESTHLPYGVKTGKDLPTFRSDVFSYGHVVRGFVLIVPWSENLKENPLYKLTQHCISNGRSVHEDCRDITIGYMAELTKE